MLSDFSPPTDSVPVSELLENYDLKWEELFALLTEGRDGEAKRGELLAARQAIASAFSKLREELTHEEQAAESLLIERDAAEEAIGQAYFLITGRSPEWSNLFGYREALDEIDGAQEMLRTETSRLRLENKRLQRESILAFYNGASATIRRYLNEQEADRAVAEIDAACERALSRLPLPDTPDTSSAGWFHALELEGEIAALRHASLTPEEAAAILDQPVAFMGPKLSPEIIRKLRFLASPETLEK